MEMDWGYRDVPTISTKKELRRLWNNFMKEKRKITRQMRKLDEDDPKARELLRKSLELNARFNKKVDAVLAKSTRKFKKRRK